MSMLSSIFGIIGMLLSLFGGSNTTRTVYGPRVTEFRGINSKYGIAIADGHGTVRQSGNLIWASKVVEKEVEHTECTKSGGIFGFGGSKACTKTINYKYFQSFAIAFGRGPASAYLRIFADGTTIADYRGTNVGAATGLLFKNADDVGGTAGITFYYGDGTNTQNATIAATEGLSNTPTYKDITYAVFNDIELEQFGNRIPVITAELAYANAVLSNSTLLLGDAPSETTYVGSKYITTQTSTSYTPIDLYNNAILGTKYYLAASALLLPYVDASDHIYSSYKYTATYSNLIQYDLLSGKAIYAYDLGANTENIVAIDFDYSNNYIYGLSNLGVYRLNKSPEYTVPVIRISTGIDKLKDNSTVVGTDASDILLDSDGTIWALRHNITGNKNTYLVKYSKTNGYIGTPIGPLSIAGYSNPNDSSTVLDFGEFITLDVTNIYVGSALSNWIVRIPKATLAPDKLLTTAITTFDRTNFRISRNQQVLKLESGVLINLGNLLITDTINFSTYFPTITSAIVHAYFIPSLSSYLLYTATQLYYGYLRFSAGGDTLKHILETIVTTIQLENLPSLLVSDTNFTSLESIIVDGYIIDAQKTLTAIMDPLAKLYAFDLIEEDGKIKSILRSYGVSSATAYEEELTSNGSDIPIINITRLLEAELPREISVTYPQASLDYQQATQRARKITTKATDMKDVAVDVVLTANKAKQAAEILLKDAWKGKELFAFTLGRKYSYLSVGDLVTFISTSGDMFFIRLNTITYGENLSIECTGSSYDAGAYSSSAIGEQGSFTPIPMPNGYPITLNIIDVPYIFRGSKNAAILYYVIYSKIADTYSLFQSVGVGISTFIGSYSSTPVVGIVVDTSNAGNTTDKLYGPENTREIDFKNSITIQVTTATGFTIPDSRDDYTNNYILIGDEAIFFKNISSLGNNKYTITGLFRDRFGYTPIAYTSHIAIGEIAILLNNSIQVATVPTPTGDNLLYVANSLSNQVNISNYEYIKPSLVGLKCLAPAKVKGVKSSNDLIISWSRRDRIDDNWTTHAALGNAETQEKYGVDIFDSDGVLKRTKTISNVSSLTYLGTEQSTDFGSVQVNYYIKVFQYNSANEKGFYSILNHQANKQYFNDISAETVGTQLSNSTKVWDTSGVSYNIIAGKYLKLDQTTSGNKALKLTDKLLVRNVEILIKFRIATTGGFSIIFRGKDNTSGLTFSISSALTSIKYSYFAAGVESVLISTTKNIDTNVWYYLKVKNIESLITAKVWKTHKYEPQDWDLTGYWAQDREVGWIGLGQQINGSSTEVAQIKVNVI